MSDRNPSPLLKRAQAMRAVLESHADACAAERRIPHETIAAFEAAGFFSMLQPKRWGGLEADPNEFFDVITEIAKACPSSAWVLGVVAVHAWQLALFPLEAQEEVWGANRATRISSSYMPVGIVTLVSGGFQLSGKWGFSSGVDCCDWVFLGAMAPSVTGEGPSEMRTFLVPKREVHIEDDWHVSGLRGTGSKSVVVTDAFVPVHRTHRMADGFRCESPGNVHNPAPWRLPR
jgi:3-hydroxy-9,10-secoandrosta-1,3,5(10)-triene-9,17-dione monooxygenase